MTFHYIKVFLRNLWKNKSFSLINIIGLSAGITCCILISVYVRHELSYDNFQENGPRLARAIMEYNIGGNVNRGNYTSTKVGPAFKKNFPEVEEFVRMYLSKRIVRQGEAVFAENRFMYADSTFFKLFSFNLIKGQARTALSGPNKVILTRSAAKKYFDSEDILGKTLKVAADGTDYVITGIMENCPDNSQIKFDFVASFSTLGEMQEETYWNANYTTYLLLKNESAIASLQKKIPGFMKKEMNTILTGNDYLTFLLEPFTSVHLYSDFQGFEPNGSITYVYVVSAVALLMLAIACFTFINLSTAKSVERAREIGVRKVTGAVRSQIFWQFIGESALIVLLSTLVSLLASSFVLPYFNSLVGRNLQVSDMLSLPVLGYCLLIIILISLFAGSYPAFILSCFQPAKVLKGSFKNTARGLLLRKSLFVFQFVISVFLVICASIIQKQLYFIQNKKLGFDKDHVVILPYDHKIQEKYAALRTELKQNTGILSVAKGSFDPSRITGGYSMRRPEMPPGKSFAVFASIVDEAYLETCRIKLVSGADLSERDVKEASYEDYTKNYFHFILNQAAAKQMGWTDEEAIGKKMFLDESRPGEVKGVVEDFHFSSMHESIKPMVFFPGPYAGKILVRLSGKEITQSLSYMEKTWKTIITHRPFEYTFLDENYKALYQSEINLGKAINIFTVLAILLACLGLFGLSSYNIQQRTKEIGILKVLGAPVSNIVVKLSKNFLWLVLLAIMISIPLAWLIMHKWLQDFVYHITINMSPFIIAAAGSFIIAIVTISFKAIRAASANPVNSLRTD